MKIEALQRIFQTWPHETGPFQDPSRQRIAEIFQRIITGGESGSSENLKELIDELVKTVFRETAFELKGEALNRLVLLADREILGEALFDYLVKKFFESFSETYFKAVSVIDRQNTGKFFELGKILAGRGILSDGLVNGVLVFFWSYIREESIEPASKAEVFEIVKGLVGRESLSDEALRGILAVLWSYMREETTEPAAKAEAFEIVKGFAKREGLSDEALSGVLAFFRTYIERVTTEPAAKAEAFEIVKGWAGKENLSDRSLNTFLKFLFIYVNQAETGLAAKAEAFEIVKGLAGRKALGNEALCGVLYFLLTYVKHETTESASKAEAFEIVKDFSGRENLGNEALCRVLYFFVIYIEQAATESAAKAEAFEIVKGLAGREALGNEVLREVLFFFAIYIEQAATEPTAKAEAFEIVKGLAGREALGNEILSGVLTFLIGYVEYQATDPAARAEVFAILKGLADREGLSNFLPLNLADFLRTYIQQDTTEPVAKAKAFEIVKRLAGREDLENEDLCMVLAFLTTYIEQGNTSLSTKVEAFEIVKGLAGREDLNAMMAGPILFFFHTYMAVMPAGERTNIWNQLVVFWQNAAGRPQANMTDVLLSLYGEYPQFVLPPVLVWRLLLADRQNTHWASVHISVAQSLTKLQERYRLDEEQTTRELLDLEHFLQIPVEGISEELLQTAQSSFQRLSLILGEETKETRTQMSMRQVLALVWRGVKDLSVLPEIEQTEAHGRERKRNFLRVLVQIQNEYAPNSPSCAGGSFNALVAALDLIHPDVAVVSVSPALVSGLLREITLELLELEGQEKKTLLKALNEKAEMELSAEEKILLKAFFLKCRETAVIKLQELGAAITGRGLQVGEEVIINPENLENLFQTAREAF
jgi:uncharacterized membrane protein